MRPSPALRSVSSLPLLLACLALGGAGAAPGTHAAPASAAPVLDLPVDSYGTYVIDPLNGTLGFRVEHLGVSYQYGRFGRFEGTFVLAGKLEECSVVLTVDAESLDSNNGARDKLWRGPEFLDTGQFPSATFTSKSIKAKDADTFSVTGDLTVHGQARTVTIDLDLVGARDVGEGRGYRAGFHGQLAIDRREFGLEALSEEELGDEIQLTIAIEGERRE